MTNEGNDKYIRIDGAVRFIKISRHATACSYSEYAWNRTDRWLGSRDQEAWVRESRGLAGNGWERR